jgi:hypothetical protein
MQEVNGTSGKKLLFVLGVVAVLILAFGAWFYWNNDHYVPVRKELSDGTSRYIISWYHDSGNYALHSLDSPDSYYIANAPSDLDKWINKEVHITGKLVAANHILQRRGYRNHDWNPAVWAVDIADIEPKTIAK